MKNKYFLIGLSVLAASLTASAQTIGLAHQSLGPIDSSELIGNYQSYVYLTGPTNYTAKVYDNLIVGICTAGNVNVYIPAINTNTANAFITWSLNFIKATKDTNAMILIPWTNGPTAFSYGTNTISYRDWNGVYWGQTNNLTMTNALQGCEIAFGPDGKSLGAIRNLK